MGCGDNDRPSAVTTERNFFYIDFSRISICHGGSLSRAELGLCNIDG